MKQGIDIWGITTGNEPLNGWIPNWPFNCMGWSAADMRNWIGQNLGPALAQLKPELNVKIITLDDNKPNVLTWAKEVFEQNFYFPSQFHVFPNLNWSPHLTGAGFLWYYPVSRSKENGLFGYFSWWKEFKMNKKRWWGNSVQLKLDRMISGNWTYADENVVSNFKLCQVV